MMATIEINETLMVTAQQLANRRSLTLQQVVESALKSFLEREEETATDVSWRQGTFRGRGVQPGIQEEDWAAIRRLLYEDQGA